MCLGLIYCSEGSSHLCGLQEDQTHLNEVGEIQPGTILGWRVCKSALFGTKISGYCATPNSLLAQCLSSNESQFKRM